MASTSPADDGFTENCPTCDTETCHDVSVRIFTESTEAENAAFSREPYRVSVCRVCGHEERVRMNNA
ncbi:hypothetical protein [Halosegnis marinus]|uniref:DUF7835 domain-containing protein n=1 Tax=Halosegnis marinus TaxID=3034023 RepID=A0ABD5ZLE7_9EURY|nr:hypothetical protein [Halosegnis sp. DT85]